MAQLPGPFLVDIDSDSQKRSVTAESLNANWSYKYFGNGKGSNINMLCAGHGKEVEDESSLQADLKRSASLDKVILVREWLKEVDGKIRLERTETR